MKNKTLHYLTEKGRGCFVLLMMAILLSPARMWGQDPVTVTIGEGTSTYYSFPVNMYYHYSLTEQIFTADEIGTAGTINSISFYYNYSSSFSMSNVTLYMKTVTRSEFASSTDMEPLSASDIVWNGTFSASGSGWITITLSTPFDYEGGNLLVAAYDGTSGYPGSSFQFRTTTCTGYKSIEWYSDSYNPNPYNMSSYSGNKYNRQYRNNIQLNITPTTTPKPKNLTASNVTPHEATLSWTAPAENVTGYQYQYMPAGGQWTALSDPITDLSVNLTSLLSDTDYTFQVKALYPDNGESNFASKVFHTEISCPVPTNLQVAPLQTGATTASLSWTENGSATNWVLQYGTTEDFSNATSVNVSGTASYTLTGLTLETRYYARVKADCGEGDLSQWSNLITFKPTNCINVNIGTQSGTTYYYPLNTSCNYSLTQQIYTAEEIETEGSIRSISFYYGYTEPLSLPGIKLFLKHVTRNSFASGSDKESLTSADLVWTGTLSAYGEGWVTIDLATPFEYDGLSNLLVCVLDETNGYPGSSYKFRYSSCSGYKCLYWYSDNYSPDPYSSSYSGSKGYNAYRNNILIGIQPATCPRPINLQATVTQSNATVATLNWTERGTASNWVLQYGTDSGFATGTYTEKTTGFVANGSSITADLTGLTPETKYYARVKADCGGGDQSAWSNTVDFRPTNCIFVTIGQETNTTSAYPVYMSSSYSLSQQIYKPEEIGYEGLIQSISFYYNYTSPFSLADIKLYLKNVARNGFVQANYYDMEYVTTADLVWSGTLSANGAGWVTIDFDTPFAYDGVSNLLVTVCDQGSESYNSSYVFLCTNYDEYLCTYKYSSSLIDPYAGQYVSNLVKYRSNIQLGILPESYPRPYNLEATLSPSDATVASLSWTEKGTATSWVLQYGTDKGFAAGTYTQKTTGFVVNGTTITYDLTGLTPETRYYARVKANYGNGNESAWSKTVDFKPTNCNYVTIGTDTYNSSNYIPVTTNYNYSLSQQIYRASEIGTEGLIRSISFYYYSFYELNMPNIKLYLKNVPRIAFASANTSEMEPLTEEDNLVWTGTLSATEKGWVTIDLDRPFAYDGVSNLLVAVWDGTNGHLDNSYVFLNSASGDKTTIYYYDASNIPNPSNPGSYSCSRSEYRNNIQIGIQPPDCPKPSNLQATLSPSNATVATLSWTELGDATNWVLQYGTDSEFAAGTFTEVSTGFVVDGTTVTANLTGLTPETRYYARVKANCGSSESIWSGTMMFRPTNCNLVDTTPSSSSSYNNTSTYPVYMSNYYSLTQQIYTADQIGMEGLIYSISFYYNTSFSFSAPDVKLYMKNVTRNAFASSSDIEPLTEDDLVWTGTFTATEAGWITIYLDEPFDYDGQSNLLVSFWDNSTGGYYDSNYQFRQYYYSSAYRSICWYSSSYIPNPYNTNGYSGSKTYSSYQNNIQLNILPTTMPRPRQLTASTIAARNATLSWEAPVAENLSGYQYQYKEGEGEWTTWSETITELSASLTGLTPETEYTFRVKAIYSNGESGFISTTFTTIPSCLPVNTPTYSDLTAHSVTISWTLQDENQDNWDLYYTHNSEDHPDNPTTYGYLIEGITTTPSYDLTLSPEAPYYIYVRANCGDYDGYSAWSTRINFAAPVACFVPSNLTVSNITNTSADFTWTPNSNGSETAWQVSYNTVNGDPLGGTLVDVEGTPSVTLQLNENTTYYVYVRANCGDYDGMSGWCSSVTFTTLQTPFIVDVTHPYSDGFENGNNWAFVNRSDSYYSIWINGNLTGNNSSRAMYIGYKDSSNKYYYSYNNNTSYAYATKRFHLAPGTYEVSYDWRCRGQENYDYCRVALVPDDATFSSSTYASYNSITFSYNSVPSEFIVLDNGSQLYSTVSNPSWQNQYHEITITEEANYKILFYWRNNNSTYYRPPIAIDNFLINVKVGPAPSNLVASNVDTRSADLTWTENGTATAWQVKYTDNGGDPYNDNVGTVVDATTTSLTLTGLRPETDYYVYVRSCIEVDGEIQYTRWSECASFTTDISCYPVTDLEIASLGSTTATLAWNTNGIQPAVNAPNSWEVVYYKAPQITYDFETNTPDYDDDNWAVGEENGNHYLYNLASNVGIYFDIVGGGVVTFKAKKTGDNTGWIYVICNNYEMESFEVYSTSEYETYQIDLSNYPGNVELNLQIYSYVALDDITVNEYDYFITHPTFDFNQGTFWDYAYYADGWSLDEDEGYIVSEANHTNEWGGAYVDFPIQLGGQVSFRAKALGVTDPETYTVRILDTHRDEVITQTTISVTSAFADYSWDLSANSGYGYLEFIANNQPSLVIDDLSFDYVSSYMTQIVDDPEVDLSGLQQFAFYDVHVRALCDVDDFSQWESISFMPAMCPLEDQCAITYNLYSPSANTWAQSDAYIKIVHHGSGITVGSITMQEAGWKSGSLSLCDGETYDLFFNYYEPKSSNTIDFAIYAPDGYLITDFEQILSTQNYSVQFDMDCSACHLPDNLAATNLMPESALVTWQQGDAEEAYNVRYRKTGAGTLLINEGFENLQEGLPTNWLSAISNYVNDQQVFEIEDEVWDLVSIQGGAISGNNMLQANENGLLLIPVQNAGVVSLKVSVEGGEVPFEKKDFYSSLAIGVFNGDINNPFELTQENIKLEVNPSGTQTCTVDLDGYTGYLVVYGIEGICIDDVMVYAPVPWTTLNDYEETSLPMDNLETGGTYQVQVQSICDDDYVSRWSALEFTTPLCDPAYQCKIKYVLSDNCNDGWEGAYLSVVHHTTNLEVARLTITRGGSLVDSLMLCEGETYDFIYTPGTCCDGEKSFVIYNHLNEFLFACETGDAPDIQTTMFTYEVNCSNCYAPIEVDYEADVTSATIYWEPGEETQTAWEIQYSTDQTNWTTVAVTSEDPVEDYMSYTIENLSASTLYYIRLRSNCGDDGYSAWTSVLDFRTDCAQYQAIPYYEDFESYDLSWPVEYRVPQCWTWINESQGSYTNNQSYPTMSNDAGGSATKYLYFLIYYYDYLNYHYGLDPQPQYAIMPEMESLSNVVLRFSGKGEKDDYWTDYYHTMVVGYVDESDVFHPVQSIELDENHFTEYTVNFNYPGSGSIYFMLDVPQTHGDRCYVSIASIDNISVELLGTELAAGWNWWAPTAETTVAELATTLGENLQHVMAETSELTSGDLVPGQMYRLQVNEDCTLPSVTTPATSAQVNLAPGAHWFGFIGSETTVTAAFANFEPVAGDKVISQNEGFAIYNGEAWVGTLTTLVPGKGYVYVSQDTESKTLNLGQ